MSPCLLQTIPLEHLPDSHTVHIALYRNVQNASFLHQQLLSGNTDFEYAFIDASVIISRLHVLAAAFRAASDGLAGKLRSRNVHSEVVFSLAMNNNIAESFRRFGITPQTTSLLILKLAPANSAPSIATHLETCIEGESIPFTDEELVGMTDLKRVRKIYKLNLGGGGGGGGGKGGGKNGNDNGINGIVRNEEEERRELEILVLGSMALRGSTS